MNHNFAHYNCHWNFVTSFLCRLFSDFPKLNQNNSAGFHDGMLKWKNHDTTNAKTIHASRKFRRWWPFKQVRVSVVDDTGAEVALAAVALVSLVCGADSISFEPTTLHAIELQISQVLRMMNYYKKRQQKTEGKINICNRL